MPSLSFMERFAGPVERGEKQQTIRRAWKRPVKVGDTLHLFEGLRTKACRRLGVGRCTRVRRIWIDERFVALDSVIVSDVGTRQLARADGFNTIDDFIAFFAGQYGLPFAGMLIKWELEGKNDA